MQAIHVSLVVVAAMASGPVWAEALSGQVVEDSSGQPLASVELRFRQPGMRELAADLETDREGRFQTTEVPRGEYTVDVLKASFLPVRFKLQAPTTDLRLRLVRYGAIDGTVSNASGQPVPGRILERGRTIGSTRVVVVTQAPGTEEFRPVQQTVVDEQGHYRFHDLPPGQYAVGVWYSGLNEGSGAQFYPDNTHPRFFNVSSGEQYSNINFTILSIPSYSVRGRVESASRQDRYQVAVGSTEQPLLPIAQTLTENDGTFLFEKIPSGTYDLFVAGPVGGYTAFESILGKGEPVFGRTRVQVVARNLEGVNIPVGPGRSVKMSVRGHGSDGPPPGCPEAFSVSLTALEPWSIAFIKDISIAVNTEQVINNLAPGRLRFTTSDLGTTCYQLKAPMVDLSRDAVNTVQVELVGAGSIHGSLKTISTLATDFAVMLVDADMTEVSQHAQLAFPDEGGEFGFEGLRPGRYRIAAHRIAEERARWLTDGSRMAEIEVSGGTPTTIELPVDEREGKL